jgi:hypothetical protein
MTAMTLDELRALPAMLDVDGTAAALGCSPWTVRAMAGRGQLTPIRLGRLVRFRLVDVLAIVGATPDMDEPSGHQPEGTVTASDPEGTRITHDQSASTLRAVR